MSSNENGMPPRLAEIVTDFQLCQGREKLEYLLEFAEKLPPLPEWLTEARDDMNQVHECMTPVYMFAERQNGHLFYHFDIPPESPTVRGYAAVLQEGTRELTPQEVLAIPHDFYLDMGLQYALTGRRINGLSAILAHMKRLAAEHLGSEAGAE